MITIGGYGKGQLNHVWIGEGEKRARWHQSEVFETREEFSNSVQLSCQESENKRSPKESLVPAWESEMVGQMWPVVGADCVSSAKT